jgi:hypothetical protein
MRGAIVVKIFLAALSLIVIYGSIDEIKKLRVMLLPASEFGRVDGRVLAVSAINDHTPGHAAGAGTTVRLYAIEFSYVAGNVTRRGNALSTICSYCARDDIVRITGRQPEALEQGAKVAVYARASQPDQAFLELPRAEDIRHQILWTLLWLVGFPMFAYGLSKAWDSGTPVTD